MLDLALTALIAFTPGRLSPAPVPDRPGALRDAAPEPDSKDPCSGREAWVGDGEDGRAPPACEGADGDPDPEAEGLLAPDWLRREEDPSLQER